MKERHTEVREDEFHSKEELLWNTNERAKIDWNTNGRVKIDFY